MGKSDPHVFNFYKNTLPDKLYESVAFLGFSKSNNFTDSIQSLKKDFYDMQLENWNINDDAWGIEKKYDLVVCTRCPYFAKDPRSFIEKSLEILRPSGYLLADWGLGDHWRYENFKIGWIKNGEHESAYSEDNHLWSFVWHQQLELMPEFLQFSENVKAKGYHDVKKAIEDEVPSLMHLEKSDFDLDFNDIKASVLTLWPDSPQLYVCYLFKKNKSGYELAQKQSN